jgi:hypothetical protein
MKTKVFDYVMETPDDFDNQKFTKDLSELAEKYNCKLAGYLSDYPTNRWKMIVELLYEIWFALRWGV